MRKEKLVELGELILGKKWQSTRTKNLLIQFEPFQALSWSDWNGEQGIANESAEVFAPTIDPLAHGDSTAVKPAHIVFGGVTACSPRDWIWYSPPD